MADWYYTKGSDRFGPIDEAELRRRLQSGEITPNDWIWREGLRGWVKVADWPGRIKDGGDSAITGDVVTATPLDPPGRSGVVNAGLESDLQAAGAVSERMLPVRQLYERVLKEVRKIFVGQDELVLGTLTALFSGGHVLIESVPGLGKTLFVRTLGRVLGCKFNRIQFTADLMPSDITGSPIFDMKTQEFIFRPGPVFTNILLADEINRSPAKTHAALLEVMQEYSVTIERTRHKLDRPFLVLATQNPIESEGTYNLPEAQMDRFMFKLVMDYPLEEEEARILMMHSVREDIDRRLEALEVVTNPGEIMEVTQRAGEVRVDPKLVNYINSLVRKTRNWPQILIGASPRAGLALMQGARTLAAFRGRDFAVPDDVVDLALPALRHRVILAPEAEVEGYRVDDVLREVIRSVEVPRL
jgi:MoxR-like ATPase